MGVAWYRVGGIGGRACCAYGAPPCLFQDDTDWSEMTEDGEGGRGSRDHASGGSRVLGEKPRSVGEGRP